jgi:hypothetical protein
MKLVKILVTGLLMSLSMVAFGQTGTYQTGNKNLKMKQSTEAVTMPALGGVSFQMEAIVAEELDKSDLSKYEGIGFMFVKPALCKVGTIPLSEDTMIFVYSQDGATFKSGKIVITKKQGKIIWGSYEANDGEFTFKGTFENITIK